MPYQFLWGVVGAVVGFFLTFIIAWSLMRLDGRPTVAGAYVALALLACPVLTFLGAVLGFYLPKIF